ncbi:MAG TPA: DUF2520 domain-containing protein [Candidatus Marinimicrobia bacterium]|nr:DUF2520 domain-containing protein [Candidatus Neomarinimicrobiota bacterium]
MNDFAGKRFNLFGASRVGVSLAYHLNRLGFKPEFVWNRSPERLAQAKQAVPFQNFSTDLKAACRDKPDWIIIAVTDDAIEEIATQISRCLPDFKAVKVFHTSGFLSSMALSSLKRKGAATGSLHPVVSVPDIATGIRLLCQCVYTCEGVIKKSLAEIVKSIGGQPYLLNRQQKETIHLSAVFLNNYVVALINAIKILNSDSNLEPSKAQAILQPITEQAVLSGWEKSATDALTGPLMRGDYQTIEKHLALLDNYPELKKLYQDFIDLALQVVAHPKL